MREMTPEWLAEKRRIAEAATPGPWEVTEFAGGEERSPGELGVFAPNHPRSYQKSDGTWYAVVICRGMDGPTREENSEYIATFDPPTVLALLDEINRLRRERAQAASLIRSAIEWIYDEETGERAWDDSDYRHALEELRQAIDLLCPEKGGDADE